MRVLVCGGRDYNDVDYALETLSLLSQRIKIAAIIQGGARGADNYAKRFAIEQQIPFFEYRARWHEQGRAAGAIRNKRMLDEGKPDLVIAFPGGRGTANMIALARAANVKVIEMDGISYGQIAQLDTEGLGSA